MKRSLFWLGFVSLLAGCQSSTLDGQNAPRLTAQAVTTSLPQYLAIGKTYQMTLAWTPVNPVVKLDGATLTVTGISGNTVSFALPSPYTLYFGSTSLDVNVAYGGPRTLQVTDGSNQASRTSYVLGTAYTTGSKEVQFLVPAGVSKATFNAWLLGTGLFTKPTQLFAPLGGPGNCAGTLAGATFDGASTFEQALEQLDALAAANPGMLMGVNPIYTDGTGTEQYDPTNTVPTVARTEVNAAAANARGYGGQGTMIAVLDTGVGSAGSGLTEFGSRLLPGQQFTPASQANPALAGNSYDDFTVGGALVGHGTQVASIAAGNTLGVAPAAQVLPVKVCDMNGKCRTSDVIRGVCWAAQQAQSAGKLNQLVINMSLGGDTGEFPNDILKKVLVSLVTQYRVLVGASFGNEWDGYLAGPLYEPHNYPGYYDLDGLLGVGALQKLSTGYLQTSLYSNRSNRIDMLAPGTLVQGYGPTGNLVTNNVGTSFAAPVVSGALALWRQKLPTATSVTIAGQVFSNSASLTRVLKPNTTTELDPYRFRWMLDLTNAP